MGGGSAIYYWNVKSNLLGDTFKINSIFTIFAFMVIGHYFTMDFNISSFLIVWIILDGFNDMIFKDNNVKPFSNSAKLNIKTRTPIFILNNEFFVDTNLKKFKFDEPSYRSE